MSGTSLIALMLDAPLIGVRKRWPETLHAIAMDGFPVATWPKGKATSACGLSGLRVAVDESGAVPWPPRVSTLPEGTVRCRECHEATGRKRPRSEFREGVSA